MKFNVSMEYAIRMAMCAPDRAKAEKFRAKLAHAIVAIRDRFTAEQEKAAAGWKAAEERFAELRLQWAERDADIRQKRVLTVISAKDADLQLGELDDRDKLFWKSQIKNAALGQSTVPAELRAPLPPQAAIAGDASQPPLLAPAPAELAPPRNGMEWPLSLYIVEHGYARPSAKQLMSLGKFVADAYRARNGRDPPKRKAYVDGAVRAVNHYTDDDVACIEAGIAEMACDFPHLALKQRRQ